MRLIRFQGDSKRAYEVINVLAEIGEGVSVDDEARQN